MDFESDDLRDRYRITGRNVGDWAFATEIAEIAERRLRQLFLGKRCVFFDVNDIAGDGSIPGIVAFVADIKVGGNPARPLDTDVTITTDDENFYTVGLLSLGIFADPDPSAPSEPVPPAAAGRPEYITFGPESVPPPERIARDDDDEIAPRHPDEDYDFDDHF